MAWRGCFLRWTKGDTIVSVTRQNRSPLCYQQRCGFRRATKKTEAKSREVEDMGLKQSELSEAAAQRKGVEPPAPRRPPRSFGRLVKPLVFTVGVRPVQASYRFCEADGRLCGLLAGTRPSAIDVQEFKCCSFGTAAIWQYEALKFRVQSYMEEARVEWLEKIRPKQGDINKQTDDMAYWHHWWNQLSDFQKQAIVVLFQVNQWWDNLTQGQRTVSGIIAANALVFCCWRVPSLQRTMVKYFISNPASKTLCFPMILSTFSHHSLFHMAANMYVLWSLSSSIVSMLGPEQFMAVYMSAVCTKIPEAKLGIIFLPMLTFSAGHALKAIVALDTAGLFLGWRLFDHAAHLGGAIFGVWYIVYGHQLIWKNREPLVKMWHDLRTKGPGGGGGGGGYHCQLQEDACPNLGCELGQATPYHPPPSCTLISWVWQSGELLHGSFGVPPRGTRLRSVSQEGRVLCVSPRWGHRFGSLHARSGSLWLGRKQDENGLAQLLDLLQGLDCRHTHLSVKLQRAESPHYASLRLTSTSGRGCLGQQVSKRAGQHFVIDQNTANPKPVIITMGDLSTEAVHGPRLQASEMKGALLHHDALRDHLCETRRQKFPGLTPSSWSFLQCFRMTSKVWGRSSNSTWMESPDTLAFMFGTVRLAAQG
ncbi:hypothetical protein JZ751_025739 [Albula glossodonta]|uniref:rhomboid protease n=1 Tax=Albula glossodonta TaxID=121402 RepID=A0A8T2NET5_9TELE|nr:hypothetical protein JZ751_025739 [Albula glossodonta]